MQLTGNQIGLSPGQYEEFKEVNIKTSGDHARLGIITDASKSSILKLLTNQVGNNGWLISREPTNNDLRFYSYGIPGEALRVDYDTGDLNVGGLNVERLGVGNITVEGGSGFYVSPKIRIAWLPGSSIGMDFNKFYVKSNNYQGNISADLWSSSLKLSRINNSGAIIETHYEIDRIRTHSPNGLNWTCGPDNSGNWNCNSP